jgi:hypothetical protein
VVSIAEVVGPESVLTVPEVDTTDFSQQLEANAGLLLGSVNAFCRKAFGISPLDEIVKPIVGDWTALESAKKAWQNAGIASDGVKENLAALPGQTQDVWIGGSGDAFRARMTSVSDNYGEYAEGCSMISRLCSALIDVAQSAGNVIAVVISFLGDLLTRLAVEASVPVLGWLAGGADLALHIKSFWEKMDKGYHAVKKVLEAVREFVEACYLVVQILNVLGLVLNTLAGLNSMNTTRSIDEAARHTFGVQA